MVYPVFDHHVLNLFGIVKDDATYLGIGKRSVDAEVLEGAGAYLELFHHLGGFEVFFYLPGSLLSKKFFDLLEQLQFKLPEIVCGNDTCWHDETVFKLNKKATEQLSFFVGGP